MIDWTEKACALCGRTVRAIRDGVDNTGDIEAELRNAAQIGAGLNEQDHSSRRCKWRMDENGTIETECGHAMGYEEEWPSERHPFCPACGRRWERVTP